MNLTNFKFKQRLPSNSVNFIFKTAGELQWPSWTRPESSYNLPPDKTFVFTVMVFWSQISSIIHVAKGNTNNSNSSCRKKPCECFLTSGSFFKSKAARFTVQNNNNNNRTAIILFSRLLTLDQVSLTHMNPAVVAQFTFPLPPPPTQTPMNKYCATCNSTQSFDKKFIHCLGRNSESVRPSTFLLSDKLKCAPGGRPRVNTRNLFSHPISGLRGEPDPSKAEATMWVTSGHPASSQSPGW